MLSENEINAVFIDRYWEILNLYEDYVTGGVKRKHPGPHRSVRSVKTIPEDKSGIDAGQASISIEERQLRLDRIVESVKNCENCDLCMQRNNTVPGEGVLDPEVMFIGEGPGEEEDRQGRPFVGKAGQYLDKWLEAIELSRDKNAFIANIVKCRPPGNRDPLPEERNECIIYLEQQIEIIRPKAIMSLGRIASQILINSGEGIGRLRGRIHKYGDIPLVATYHPSAVLRNEELRRPVWEDLKLLRTVIGHE